MIEDAAPGSLGRGNSVLPIDGFAAGRRKLHLTVAKNSWKSNGPKDLYV
jgi:hypothetical protein